MIYIICGASGTGKTTLLEMAYERLTNISIHVKGTTRHKRQYDDEEIISYPDGFPENKYDYIYSQYGFEYGIEKIQIDASLLNNVNHLIICNDKETISKLKKDYKAKLKVIFMIYDAPKDILLATQKTRNINDDEIALRLKKYSAIQEECLNPPYIFDEVIKNTYGESPAKSMIRQLKRIIENYDSNSSSISAVLGIERQQMAPYEVSENEIVQKGLLFIIMAMNPDDNELCNIEYSIKNAAKSKGFTPQRIDDNTTFEPITQKILSHIELAEVVVADLSRERPNCYFELGYALALKKQIVVTAFKWEKIHFDVNGYSRIEYSTYAELDKALQEQLALFAKNGIK